MNQPSINTHQLANGIIIRPMKFEDVADVQAIEQAGHPFPWSRNILEDCLLVGYSSWVIEKHGHAVGFAIMSFAAGEGHLLNICITPSHQRQGLGRHLLKHMLVIAKSAGVTILFLEVRSSNTTAIALYEEFGFNEVTVRKGYYPAAKGREDAIILALSL